MKLKLKKDLKSPRWSHAVPTIPKGSLVEYDENNKTVQHPTGALIMIKDPSKYFDQLFLMKSDLPFAGKGKVHTAKEWKRIFGHEVGFVAGVKFVPVIDLKVSDNPNL